MSISSGAVRKAGPFNGNGATTAFPFTFKVFQAADVLVVQTDTTPTDHTMVLNTDYTVALNSNQDSNPGGTVNMTVAPPSGYLLTIGSQQQQLQSTVLTNTGGFYPTVINNALDFVTILIQQLSEKLGRALVLPFSTGSNVSAQLPPVSPGSLIGWNQAGTGLQNAGGTGIAPGGVVASNMAAGATGTALGTDVTAAAVKATPADADEVPLYDSAAQFSLKSLTWANLRTTLANLCSAGWNAATATLAAAATTVSGIGNAAAFDARYNNSAVGSFRNLKIDALGLNNYNCVITADEVVLENSSNQYLTVRAVNKTINSNGTVGAPLSIMSARAASTWYYRWLWYNATNGLTATLDTSNTAPTAPTGYASTDYKALLPGACRTDASGSTYLLQTSTRGRISRYVVLAASNTAALPIMASGTAGAPTTPTWVAIAVSSFVPSTANRINLAIGGQYSTGSAIICAPNSSYGPVGSTTNSPPISRTAANGETDVRVDDMLLESANIYWASGSSAGAFIACVGWKDN